MISSYFATQPNRAGIDALFTNYSISTLTLNSSLFGPLHYALVRCPVSRCRLTRILLLFRNRPIRRFRTPYTRPEWKSKPCIHKRSILPNTLSCDLYGVTQSLAICTLNTVCSDYFSLTQRLDIIWGLKIEIITRWGGISAKIFCGGGGGNLQMTKK